MSKLAMSKRKPRGYWNKKENCAAEARKYTTRWAFYEGSRGAYYAAKRNGWLDDICGHMERGKNGFDLEKPGYLYYLAVDTRTYDRLYKVGITNRSVEERFSVSDLEMVTKLHVEYFEVGQDAYDKEQMILANHQWDRYEGPDKILESGNTELFTRDIRGLDHQCVRS